MFFSPPFKKINRNSESQIKETNKAICFEKLKGAIINMLFFINFKGHMIFFSTTGKPVFIHKKKNHKCIGVFKKKQHSIN